MDTQTAAIKVFLDSVHPYDSLPLDELVQTATSFSRREYKPGEQVYTMGDPLDGIYLVKRGTIEVTDGVGVTVSILGPRNSFGERGLLRDGRAVTSATATEDSVVLVLPEVQWRHLIAVKPAFERFFSRSRAADARGNELSTLKVSDLMARNPVTIAMEASIAQAARLMRDNHISSLAVTEGGVLKGIVTTGDLTARVLAEGLGGETLVGQVMTRDPLALGPDALGSDILHAMLERRIGHVPVVQDGKLKGIVTQTDLTRYQAVNSAQLVRDAAESNTADEMAQVTARIPKLLSQLVAANNAHEVVTRLITDVADTVTRRLLRLAEAQLGPAPVPYLWLACGSQGRQEQTGVSDQDNCLILDDSVGEDDMAYFHALARFVSDGMNTAGYVYCPGDMMATNPRWCQPLRVWRRYFDSWITSPSTEAQMLASVMFDLRPIGGHMTLFRDLEEETLTAASRNSIFVAHMISNSLKHQPPLGLLRGFATIRSGEFKNHIDMKHNGVVPVADLARVYALQARLPETNTRARIEAAEAAGVISVSGARDLVDAYDFIAQLRLEAQADLVKAGRRPDNFLAPSDLSDFERSHLRDAFVVVRTMQSALGQRAGTLG
ncbi:putative nucleotidyltransferase substrate binding domain-containing protein [Pararhodobacter oceanensis]|uniref:Histidine kinase n=1 Tax=Pararhodobacter oceanensis TaxID=2172121 RepID=A0A2T8HW56_9RHOB|nr:putative nucleotidyltransferase substrate binding domain-containing protein [Pararhodobacter oceanensis]PVH29665.1 histidine kinase [Pararhodobacter oceanensis]